MAKRTNETPSTTPAPDRRRTGTTRTARTTDPVTLETAADRGLDQAADTVGASPSPDAIARRAYELYVRRGGINGHDVEDWLEAERQLRRSYRR